MRIGTLLVFALALLPACSSPVPATVTWGPSMQIGEGRGVFVTANEQAPRVQQSLRDAGLSVVEASDAPYLLRVDVGNSRGGQACGRTKNVRYILHKGRARILVLKGRGRTGQCSPNIFDDMSRLLESYFGDGG